MGYPSKQTTTSVRLRNGQRKNFETSVTTRITIGGYERITYKEVVNGVTIIRTRWRRKKTKEKYRKS